MYLFKPKELVSLQLLSFQKCLEELLSEAGDKNIHFK